MGASSSPSSAGIVRIPGQASGFAWIAFGPIIPGQATLAYRHRVRQRVVEQPVVAPQGRFAIGQDGDASGSGRHGDSASALAPTIPRAMAAALLTGFPDGLAPRFYKPSAMWAGAWRAGLLDCAPLRSRLQDRNTDMRRRIVAGNWKLHGDRAFAHALLDEIAASPRPGRCRPGRAAAACLT
jgi:hypothetical protein